MATDLRTPVSVPKHRTRIVFLANFPWPWPDGVYYVFCQGTYRGRDQNMKDQDTRQTHSTLAYPGPSQPSIQNLSMFIQLILILIKICAKSHFYYHKLTALLQRFMPSLPTPVSRSYPHPPDVSQFPMDTSTQIEPIFVLQLRPADITPVVMVMAVLFFLALKYACVQVACITSTVVVCIKDAFSFLSPRGLRRETGTEEEDCPNGSESNTSDRDCQDNPQT